MEDIKNEAIKADFAIIGGSGTLSSNFPENIQSTDVKILNNNIFVDTPYGKSPSFTLFSINKKLGLTCKMHGWRSGISRADASRQIFWTFRQVGIKRISPFFIPSCLINLISGTVSIDHSLRGPNHACVTACSTGTHAIGDAARIIAMGDADVMVAGGAESAVNVLGLAGSDQSLKTMG